MTAVSFRSGRTVWRKLAGTGFFFNNNYAGLAISPRGTFYLGVLGGTIKVADRTRPRLPRSRSHRSCPSRAVVTPAC